MRDRMPPEMLARAKGQARAANTAGKLAETAKGFGVTRVDRDKARRKLVETYGERRANQLQEQAAQRHGAAPKGFLRSLLGG